MDSPGLMSAAVELMLLGMGTVFVFLTLLVGFTTLMSRVLARFAPPVQQSTQALPAAVSPGNVAPDASLHAVIVAAIHAHRSRR